jgi:hypothetical protein
LAASVSSISSFILINFSMDNAFKATGLSFGNVRGITLSALTSEAFQAVISYGGNLRVRV